MARTERKGSPQRIVALCKRLDEQSSDIKKDEDAHFALVPEGLTGEEAIATWPLATRAKPDALAEAVLDEAQADANSRGQTTQYLLRAVVNGRPLQTYRIRCLPEEDDPWAGTSGSVADIVAQALKHNEVLMRATLGSLDGVIRQQGKVIDMLSAKLELMDSTHREALELYAEGTKLAAVAETDAGDAEAKRERIDRLIRLGEMVVVKAMEDGDAKKVVKLASKTARGKKGSGTDGE